MLRSISFLSLAAAAMAIAGNTATAQPDPTDTRLFSMPAIGPKKIAFVYSDDLWTADRDGKNPRRLTTDIGLESNPVFSPDGKTIAFSAEYDGNTDVYTIPITGGAPASSLTIVPKAKEASSAMFAPPVTLVSSTASVSSHSSCVSPEMATAMLPLVCPAGIVTLPAAASV